MPSNFAGKKLWFLDGEVEKIGTTNNGLEVKRGARLYVDWDVTLESFPNFVAEAKLFPIEIRVITS